jgi:hypothetical protein
MGEYKTEYQNEGVIGQKRKRDTLDFNFSMVFFLVTFFTFFVTFLSLRLSLSLRSKPKA